MNTLHTPLPLVPDHPAAPAWSREDGAATFLYEQRKTRATVLALVQERARRTGKAAPSERDFEWPVERHDD